MLDSHKLKKIITHLEDKKIFEAQEFGSPKRKKNTGVTSGYIADREGQDFMLKPGEIEVDNTPIVNGARSSEKQDVLSEILFSELYSRILKDRAPAIGLLTDSHGSAEEEHIYLRSKFLNHFIDLKEFKRREIESHNDRNIVISSLNTPEEVSQMNKNEISLGVIDGKIYYQTHSNPEPQPFLFSRMPKPNTKIHREIADDIANVELESSKLREIFFKHEEQFCKDENFREYLQNNETRQIHLEGFEKVIAASLFLGEVDYHHENIGLVENAYGELRAAKIDHGRSGKLIQNKLSKEELMQKFIASRPTMQIDSVAFNVDKFDNAIKEILTISNEEIESFIQKDLYKIKSTGFKLNPTYYDIDISTKIVDANIADSTDKSIKINFKDNQTIELTTPKNEKLTLNIDENNNLYFLDNNGQEKHIDINIDALKTLTRSSSLDKNKRDTAEKLFVFLKAHSGYNENNERFKKLEAIISTQLIQQKQLFADLSQDLSIISKIDADSEFKTKTWCEIFTSNKEQITPIEYAIKHHLTIEGLNPADWALNHQELKPCREFSKQQISEQNPPLEINTEAVVAAKKIASLIETSNKIRRAPRAILNTPHRDIARGN